MKSLGIAVFLTNLYSVFLMKKFIPLEIILCQNVGLAIPMEESNVFGLSKIEEKSRNYAQSSYGMCNDWRLKMEQRVANLIQNGKDSVK